MRHAVALFLLMAAASAALLASAGQRTPEQNPEEALLQAAGLSADGDALLEFFRERTQPTADMDKLVALARELGDANAQTRDKAAARLVASGSWSVPALRHVANELGNPLAAQQARRCLEWIKGPKSTEVPIAAAKLLAVRKPAAAAGALLAYLPLADDQAVVDAVKAALAGIAAAPGKTDLALLAALQDPLPLRRAIAGEVLAASGRAEPLPEVRKLLADNKPQVRLRTALALAQRSDEMAVGVLVDLLAELRSEERRQVEQVLQQLAGEWAPTPALKGDDVLSRKVHHEAWAGWWRTLDGPALLASIRLRTLSNEDLGRAQSLIDQLGDKSFAKRERAVVEILAMGPKVIGLLREAIKGNDLEQVRRAEICLKQIMHKEETEKLPAAAARLLAVRKPAGTTEALLAYLAFTDDRSMHEEIGKALKNLVLAGGEPDPAVLKALTDTVPLRRIAAAEALAGAGGAAHPAVRKLLTDANPEVRLHVAVALVYARNREAVPALIDLVAELPRSQVWEAEELLHRLAGAKAPPMPAGDDAASRKKLREAWLAWWKDHGATVNMAELEKATGGPSLVVVAEIALVGNAPAAVGQIGNGRLVAIDRNAQPHWKIEKLDHPIDFQVLPGNRVLIAEYASKRVTERDLNGKILWETTNLPGAPINVQRLANGNTFIAAYNGTANAGCYLVEVDRAGKTVSTVTVSGGPAPVMRPGYIRGAYKMANGNVVCLMSTVAAGCVLLDATGKEIKSFPMPVLAGINFFGNIDVTPKGNIVVFQNNNTVTEYDPDGKIVWQANVTANRATRLPSGNTLVASQTIGVIELDNTGKTVWQYKPPAGYQSIRARQTGSLPLTAAPIVAPPAIVFPALPVPDAVALAKKPSIADAFKRADIPAAVLAKMGSGKDDAPKELVAVLGKADVKHLVVSLSLTSDGRYLATGGELENKAQLFDLKTGQLVKTFPGAAQKIRAAAISPDGKSLATALMGKGPLSLWNTETSALRATLAGHTTSVWGMDISPDGKLLASAGFDRAVRLWDVATGAAVGAPLLHKTNANRVAFSPDGKWLASASGTPKINGEVIISEVATGRIVGRLNGQAGEIRGLAWHPDGRSLASGSLDGTIWLWDLDAMKSTRVLRGNFAQVQAVAWHPSGHFLASNDHAAGAILLWDMRVPAPQPRVIRLFPAGPKADVWTHDVVFTPDGRHLIAGNPDGTVSVLRLAELGQLIRN